MPQTDDPVSREHLQAIGSITVNFQMLESWLGMITWKLISDDQLLGQTITAGLSFRKLVDLLSSLSLYRAIEQTEDLDTLLKRALHVEDRRNTTMHSRWGSGDSPQTVTRSKTTARRPKGLQHHSELKSVADLNEFAEEIWNLISDLRAFFQRL